MSYLPNILPVSTGLLPGSEGRSPVTGGSLEARTAGNITLKQIERRILEI